MPRRPAAPTQVTLAQTLDALRAQARPDQLAGMARVGITGDGRLGVSMPTLRALGRTVGRDQALAEALWETGIPDARILATLVAEPDRCTDRLLDRWATGLAAWDVCDQFCLNLVRRTPSAWRCAARWSGRRPEFVRRAGLALYAVLAVHDDADDAPFIAALPRIVAAADDDRNYVKKAASWALRQIGKRNAVLQREVLTSARALATRESRAAQWIARDVLAEVGSKEDRKRPPARGGVRPPNSGTPRPAQRTSGVSRR